MQKARRIYGVEMFTMETNPHGRTQVWWKCVNFSTIRKTNAATIAGINWGIVFIRHSRYQSEVPPCMAPHRAKRRHRSYISFNFRYSTDDTCIYIYIYVSDLKSRFSSLMVELWATKCTCTYNKMEKFPYAFDLLNKRSESTSCWWLRAQQCNTELQKCMLWFVISNGSIGPSCVEGPPRPFNDSASADSVFPGRRL
jgi:hypothetical protein